jgi:hypothetical protein
MLISIFGAIKNHKKKPPPSMPYNIQYKKLLVDIIGQKKKCNSEQKAKHKSKIQTN